MSINQDEYHRRIVVAMRRHLGEETCARIDDPDIIEIMLNPDGRVWEDRLGKGMCQIGTMTPAAAETFIGSVAAIHQVVVDRANPVLECELPIKGARFAAAIAPVSPAPSFSIRFKSSQLITLAEYEARGVMTAAQRRAIEDGIISRYNMMIVGATGSGKTTLGNGILAEMARVAVDDRIAILEDTVELQCPAPNVFALRATADVTLHRLLKLTMRMRPDRIVVGEVRDGACMDMMKAWNTGHKGGFGTIHANSARAALTRIEQLVAEVSASPQQVLIGEAIDLIVSIAKVGTERRVQEVMRVHGFEDGKYLTSIVENV